MEIVEKRGIARGDTQLVSRGTYSAEMNPAGSIFAAFVVGDISSQILYPDEVIAFFGELSCAVAGGIYQRTGTVMPGRALFHG